jgi:universal stress protein E
VRAFKKILLGVDISRGDKLVAKRLAPHAQIAVQTAMELARVNSSHLRFFYTLDVSVQARIAMQQEGHHLEPTICERSYARLAVLEDQARQGGVSADSRVVFGRSWKKIVEEVLLGGYDLVVIGSNRSQKFGSFLKSTEVKLLRKCPCPVWVARTPLKNEVSSILVAHDFTPAGQRATELAEYFAERHGAELHVLNPKELGRVRAIDSNLCSAALEFVKQNEIELSVLGAESCKGITGLLRRHPVERLISVPCSLLSVRSPVAHSTGTPDQSLAASA